MNEMPEAERERLAKVQSELQVELGKLVINQQELMRDLVADIRAIERSFAARLIIPAIEALKTTFANASVSSYLDQAAEHMLNTSNAFVKAARTHLARTPRPMRPALMKACASLTMR